MTGIKGKYAAETLRSFAVPSSWNDQHGAVAETEET